jgi:hypothetical protein
VALPALGVATFHYAYAINLHGTSVGYSVANETCSNTPYNPLNHRAVIWDKNGTVSDLNSLIPRRVALDLQLTVASAINDRGEILVRGIRINEPKDRCPTYVLDPVTNEFVYDASTTCYSERAYLLVPRDSSAD